MPPRSAWIGWIRSLLGGRFIAVEELDYTTRVQLVFVAALLAAAIDVVSAWIVWSNPPLRSQYAALNALVAKQVGYTAPPIGEFSALGVFVASLIPGSIGALLLWTLAAFLSFRLVCRHIPGLGVLVPTAVFPLPLVSAVGLLTTLVQLGVGSISATPSLAAFIEPTAVDVRLYSIAAKIDLGALMHAVVMTRLLFPSSGWRTVLLRGSMVFVVRSGIVAAGILLVAQIAGL
ncbi:MAG: hypothetical protein RML15_04010 [Bacteroidota bacterium]|nr:hypothetical protein [Bacteroidota bacterium]